MKAALGWLAGAALAVAAPAAANDPGAI